MIVLTGMLLILATITMPLSDQARADAEKITKLADAREAAGALANAINSVYAAGVGSTQTVDYWLPKGTVSVSFVDGAENRLDVKIELDLENDNAVQVSTILPNTAYENSVVLRGHIIIRSNYRVFHRTTVRHIYESGVSQPRRILVVDSIPFLTYVVYSDEGMGHWVQGTSAVYTWDGSDWGGPAADYNGDYTGESPPEGNKCWKTASGADWDGNTNYAGWGYYNPEDLSAYAGGDLIFWVKTPADLKVEINDGSNHTKYISAYGWDGTNTWQDITIPLDDFGADLSAIEYPFMITIEAGDSTFYTDSVRWVVQSP